MDRAINPLLMLVPAEMLGVASVLLLVAGGLAIIIGLRRAGWAMVVIGIALPVMMVVLDALMGSMFLLLPDMLVLPIAMAMIALSYLLLGWGLVKMLFGQRAVDAAKGHLLADAVKGTLKLMFTWPALSLMTGGFLYLWWRMI